MGFSSNTKELMQQASLRWSLKAKEMQPNDSMQRKPTGQENLDRKRRNHSRKHHRPVLKNRSLKQLKNHYRLEDPSTKLPSKRSKLEPQRSRWFLVMNKLGPLLFRSCLFRSKLHLIMENIDHPCQCIIQTAGMMYQCIGHTPTQSQSWNQNLQGQRLQLIDQRVLQKTLNQMQ